MPIYATTEALDFWKEGHSRSLAANRFLHIASSKNDSSWRKDSCDGIHKGSVHPAFIEHQQTRNLQLTENGSAIIFAKLEARLILNAGGGVFENGGVSIDRNSGLANIPGSAIKACARRHAIWQLSQQPDLAKKAELLAQLAITFGYGDQEWIAGRKSNSDHPNGGPSHSDFWLAMVPIENTGKDFDQERDQHWSTVADSAQALISTQLGTETCPNQLSGCVAFFPSSPGKDTGIDTDILTSHHGKYYSGDKEIATDDEDPNPVVFPAIPKDTAFQFLLHPCQRWCSAELLEAAKSHLSEGLQIFGLGAKTNAGYGWFSIDTSSQRKADEKRQQHEEEQAKQTMLESMDDDERTEFELADLSHEDFVEVCKNIENEDEDKQVVVCKMLSSSKKQNWKDWKKAKKWKSRIPIIREVAAKHNITLS